MTVNLANQLAREDWDICIVTVADVKRDCYELHTAVRRIALDLESESSNLLVAIANNAGRIRALREILLSERPDVALAMMNTAGILLAFAARGLDIVTIGAERANPSTAHLGRAWSWLRRVAYRRLHAIVALTPEAAKWLSKNTGVASIAVIPNAITWPLADQAPSVDPGSVGVPGRNRLLAVGRLAKVKGTDNLVKAFALIASRHQDWELVIVGEGAERSALQAQIDRSGLSDRAILAGEAGNLADWYRHAQLFALSSRHEGFPNVLLEAMAHGLACVSFDCEAGPRNIMRHGVDGLLVPNQDVEALAAALDRLMDDDEMRMRLATQAAEVRERFSATHIMNMWRDLIATKLGLDDRIDTRQGVSRPV